MLRLSKYVIYDIIRNKVVIAYSVFLFLVSMALFHLEGNPNKAILGLLNIILIVLPLVSIVFATIHWYNSYEFIELMLCQPVSRKKVLISEYLGLSLSLLAAFLIGVGIPALLYSGNETGMAVILVGSMLTLIFTAIAFLASVRSKDKARGIGTVLLLWFYFALIYDGLVLLLLFSFSDYPLEKITLVLSSLNPVDLGRICIMLHLDISALMGYTGATYKDFFGSSLGMFYTLGVMIIWLLVPFYLSLISFNKKNL